MDIKLDQSEARALLLTLEIAATAVQRVALKVQEAARQEAIANTPPTEPVVVPE